jgi:hypothetical protein
MTHNRPIRMHKAKVQRYDDATLCGHMYNRRMGSIVAWVLVTMRGDDDDDLRRVSLAVPQG